MGSQGGGGTQEPKLHSPTGQGSLYNLTLDEVQTHLGNLGKPLSSMNLDELLKSLWAAETNQAIGMGIDNTAAPPSPVAEATDGLRQQPSLTLSGALSMKTVDEVWREIQKGQQKISNQEKVTRERQPTLGEMTLEDFLVKAGMVGDSIPGKQNAGPDLAASQQNMPQQAQWIHLQLPSVQQSQQQNMMAVFLPAGHKNPVSDAACPETQMTMSPSALMGAQSDTQMPGRKRVAQGDVLEKNVERRQKRMIKNRESAARSRARKQAYTHELENKVLHLEEEIERLKKQKEVEKALPCAPPPEPKYQHRRTSSAPF
ncbi:ABSCISIC ACID-INSENSITIVE 5-like protein 2 [Malania oleifera]|uniref:ABSCISIC ACID-INSENSITIVE 5-like protein 2 n=1 Tax=Malania oleifera TaxID=397392 RepID=UPI0025ADABD0|nr:ABSCISIC ACID-INSENSITIVE 5-like protein 2 [Malania oleifera]